MDKEAKDRKAEYYKELLKSKYEYIRAILWTILVVGSGVFGLVLATDFETSFKFQFMAYLGFVFETGSIVYLLVLMKKVRFYLNELKKL